MIKLLTLSVFALLICPLNLDSASFTDISSIISTEEINKIIMGYIKSQSGELVSALNHVLSINKQPITVFLPKGTYLVKEAIKLNRPIKLIGADGCVIKLDESKYNTNVIIVSSTNNVEINNIKIIGAASEKTNNNERSGIGISVEGSYKVVIKKTQIESCWYGIRCASSIPDSRAFGIEIDSNLVSYNMRSGIVLDGCSDVSIRDNTSENNGSDNSRKLGNYPGYGVLIMNYQGKTDAITCTNNVCRFNRASGIGVWSYNIHSGPSEIMISNNTCYNNRVHGIILASCSNSTVQRNKCYDNNRKLTNNLLYRPFTYSANGIHIEVASRNITIKGNECYETMEYDGTSEELQCAGITCGAGYPIEKEPAPENIYIIENIAYNNKRYQKSVMNSPLYRYSAKEIDGDAPIGRYKSRFLFRDGRDNIELDRYTINSTHLINNIFINPKQYTTQ